MSKEVNSIEEFIAGGISELQALADKGNTVAQEWLQIIQQEDTTISKLAIFGEMRITLHSSLSLSDEEKEKEVRQVYDAMWPSDAKE